MKLKGQNSRMVYLAMQLWCSQYTLLATPFCVSAGTSDIFYVKYICLPLMFILRRFNLRVNYSSVAKMVGS